MPESMSPTVEFTSVAKEFRHEYIVDKSRFITTIYLVQLKKRRKPSSVASTKSFGMPLITATAYSIRS